jgi:glycyl-tRNA synthetase beta chain
VGLVTVVKRVKSLSEFLSTDNGRSLLAGYKRAANLLAKEEEIEERNNNFLAFDMPPEVTFLTMPNEIALIRELESVHLAVSAAVEQLDYAAAMTAMARLRGPVDAFLDGTFVNDPDPAIRLNRLRLLASLRRVTATVADFSKVAG